MSTTTRTRLRTSLAPTPEATVLLALTALLGGCVVVASGVGAVEVSPRVMWQTMVEGAASSVEGRIWLHVRLPRVLLAVLVGAALATAGALLQGLFRNPLADAGVIGLASGGALGAAGATLLVTRSALQLSGALAGLYLPLAAFVGALVAALVLERLAVRERTNAARLLLAGVAINALAGAATGILVTLADDAELRTITFWTLGSLGGATWPLLAAAGPLLVLALVVAPRLARALDLLLLGERAAAHLGVDVVRTQRHVVVLASALVGSAVATSGVIGFVGLVVPHLVRLLLGPAHRALLPASALGGAVLVVLTDLLARTVVAPRELPLGLVTALLGAPLFLWMLQRRGAVGGAS